jgi:hypothetical protein
MLDAKTLSLMQERDNLRAAKRSGKTGTRLLDDGENNVGNAIVLQPQTLSAGVNFTTVRQDAINGRILNLTASSKSGQSVTVVMTAARTAEDRSGVAGPITGVLEFGNGTQSTKIEFDIPVGPYVGNIRASSAGSQPEDSGAVIQVPTGIIRAYARYDNAYITPELGGFAFGGPGSPAFPLFAGTGPFSPNTNLPIAVQVKAFADYFGRHHTKLYKTQYAYIGNSTLPQAFSGIYAIPPFAKSVQIIPAPAVSMTANITYSIPIGSNSPNPFEFDERYIITAGTYPVIPIEGNATLIQLANTGVGDLVYGVKLVYEIGF